MRAPRPGTPWSRGRVKRRHRYASYIESPEWFARRRAWLQEWNERHDAAPTCRVCGRLWLLSAGDLHHATYDRLGHELFEDLVPLCRAHHTALHDLYDRSPAWRRLGRSQATFGIIYALRRQHEGVGR